MAGVTQAAADKYILDSDGHPVAETDLMVWAEWFERSGEMRIVEQSAIEGCRVVTIFLSLDHSYGCANRDVPILYETMVVGGKLDQETQRYSTRDEAKEGHREMCNRIKAQAVFLESKQSWSHTRLWRHIITTLVKK